MITLVQSNKGSFQNVTTASLAFTLPVTSGNLLIVTWFVNSKGAINIPSGVTGNPTDTLGNTYGGPAVGGGILTYGGGLGINASGYMVSQLASVAGGACTVTYDASGDISSGTVDIDMIIAEYTPGLPLGSKISGSPITSLPPGSINDPIVIALTNAASHYVVMFGSAYDSTNIPTWITSDPIIEQTANPDGFSLILCVHSSVVNTAYNFSYSGFTSATDFVGGSGMSILVPSPPPLAITCGSPPPGMVGITYGHAFPATGGTSPYTFSITTGVLPPDLTLDATTGIVSGFPTSAATYAFTIQVTDSLSTTAAVACSITIAAGMCAASGTKLLHSIRRLNDPDRSLAPSGYLYVVGNGTTLDAGIETALTQIDSGYSGDPLSLLAFRPEQSPESWMYVYDRKKQSKVSAGGFVRPIGVVPPNVAPAVAYGIPANVNINTGQSNTSWTNSGAAGAPMPTDRTQAQEAIASATNANPAVLTTTVAPASGPVVISGFTGSWAPLNGLHTATHISPTTFSVPIDSTGFGAVTGTPILLPLLIGTILYDSGTTGWCAISPNMDTSAWAGDRMKVILDNGGGNQETVMVREVHAAITSLTTITISGIIYDSGTSGLCCIVLAGCPSGLARNSLIQIATQGGDGATEIVKVISKTLTADGTAYSFRCSTANKHSAGATVTGKISWYTYTAQTHVISETVTSEYLAVSQAGAGTGNIQLIVAENCSEALGRPLDTANDYLHVSVFLQNPTNVTTLTIFVDIDPNTPLGGTPFTGSFWSYTIPQAQLIASALSSGDAWVDVAVPMAQGVQSGLHSLTLSGVQAVGLQLVSTGACAWGFDWLYYFGTYSPTIQPNAPTGYFYTSTFRDPSTGAASVPGPITRYSVFPLRENLLITPATTTAAGIGNADVYREGGSLDTFNYVGSTVNPTGGPVSDTLSDLSLSTNPEVDLTLIQPWPVIGLPLSGTVNVVGTSITWVSGDKFPLAMIGNSVIQFEGTSYLTYGQPLTDQLVQVAASDNVLSGAVFTIAAPTLAGQALPVAFGPLEGPFSPVAFAVGDVFNPGTLYFSNSANLDAAADTNTLEVTSPTEPLVTGEVWNGLAFVGSRENVFLVRYSYLASQGGTPYQFQRLAGASGFWSRWAICRGPDGVYALGRDGIYLWTESGGVNVSDSLLYPLFPHGGEPAKGANGLLPVNMELISFMRLSYTDESIRFIYMDTACNQVTLRYELPRRRWFVHYYADTMSMEYLDEPLVDSPNTQQILQLSRNKGRIYIAQGNTDVSGMTGAPVVITSQVQTPYMDGGDFRMQRLYIDTMIDADQAGTIDTAMFFNDGVTNTGITTIIQLGPRTQTPVNISSVPSGLNLYRNISVKMVFTGGPSGPRLYGCEPTWYDQAYISKRLTTQYHGLSFPGYKLMRRAYPALISTTPVTFLIQTQDGRAYSIVIPSTGGQLLQQSIMLPQDAKSLLFALELSTSDGSEFAVFTDEFVVEVKEWSEPSFIKLAVFRA